MPPACAVSCQNPHLHSFFQRGAGQGRGQGHGAGLGRLLTSSICLQARLTLMKRAGSYTVWPAGVVPRATHGRWG